MYPQIAYCVKQKHIFLFHYGLNIVSISFLLSVWIQNHLFIYFKFTVMEGLLAVFGEYELAYHGVGREQMVISLSIGYAAALFVGTFLGMLSDLM